MGLSKNIFWWTIRIPFYASFYAALLLASSTHLQHDSKPGSTAYIPTLLCKKRFSGHATWRLESIFCVKL